jgi:hypothetical protein
MIAERDDALERRAPEMALARDCLALAGHTGRTSGRQTGGSSAHDSRGLCGVSLREDENAAPKWGRDAGAPCDDRSGCGEGVVHPAGELDDALLACPARARRAIAAERGPDSLPLRKLLPKMESFAGREAVG